MNKTYSRPPCRSRSEIALPPAAFPRYRAARGMLGAGSPFSVRFYNGIAAVIFAALLAGGILAAEEYSSSRGGGTSRLTVSLPAGPAAPPALPKTLDDLRRAAGEDYIVMARDNFLIASDLEFEEAEYLVDGVFDFCRRALALLYFDMFPDSPRVVNLFLFRDYGSYAAGLRRFFAMDPISPYGHYGHSQKYVVINYDTGPGTMVHEMTHALMAEDFPEAPIWIAEGMASLYEQCRAEGRVLRGEDNWRLPELKAAVQRNALTPLGSLLVMSPASFRAGRESLHYAQARYLCKYFEELGILPSIYKNFRDNHKLDPSGSRFIVQAYGKQLDAIEAAWKRWISFQQYTDAP